MFRFASANKSRSVRQLLVAGLAGVAALSGASAAPASTDAEAMAQENWRETIARTAVPFEGCFEAEYPSSAWAKVECVVAPDRVYVPHAAKAGRQTVGDGVDYAASVTGFMTSAVGTFPTVTGVTSEKDGRANIYSLQINSNFMTTSVCDGHPGCNSWEQFVYSSGEKSAFMQYWLINYGTCPSGWNTFQSDCYKNSAAVAVPREAISTLSSLKLSGSAVLNGVDTLVFTTPTKAYSTTGQDSVVGLATGWQQAEFNIIGDGGGSKAVFNKGSSLTVKLAVANGTTNAPTCASNAGTTGETNNLTLKSCNGVGGATPYIQFVESN